MIDARSVTTEINTVFQTLTSIAETVDPIKLNLTLTGAADALSGLGGKFGTSLVNGNKILDNLNPRMDQLHHDVDSWPGWLTSWPTRHRTCGTSWPT